MICRPQNAGGFRLAWGRMAVERDAGRLGVDDLTFTGSDTLCQSCPRQCRCVICAYSPVPRPQEGHSHYLYGSEGEKGNNQHSFHHNIVRIFTQSVTPMADPRFPQPEQDVSGNGDLPTYDALAADAGPNSRSVPPSLG